MSTGLFRSGWARFGLVAGFLSVLSLNSSGAPAPLMSASLRAGAVLALAAPEQAPNWTTEGDQSQAFYSYAVAGGGDLNGDGYDEVIVGAHRYDSGTGRVYVYYGSAAGLSTTPGLTLSGQQAGEYFGQSVAVAGDVNHDGFDDVVIGAPRYTNSEYREGRACLYLGSASGLGEIPAWTLESDQVGAQLGGAVAGAGDVNGDSYSDVIIGASYFDADGLTNQGRAFVYHGSASGLSATADWYAGSGQADAWFGYSVASAGDVNGDGKDDVLVGAQGFDGLLTPETDEGAVFLYFGSASGLSSTAAWSAEGDQTGAEFGVSVSSAGDVNGDGYDDVVIGADWFNATSTDNGKVVVYLGSVGGPGGTPDWTVEGDQEGAWFGCSVASAGDVNADGYGDVIVGARLYDNPEEDEGRAFVYLGSASGLSQAPAWTAEADGQMAYFGAAVASAGDVDGDFADEVLVGAYGFRSDSNVLGKAFVYAGEPLDTDSDGVPESLDACPHTVPGASVDEHGCPPIIFGDFDRDGDVGQLDLAIFWDCTSGPALTHDQDCQAANADEDTDVDQDDFGLFQRCYAGESVPADPACDDPADEPLDVDSDGVVDALDSCPQTVPGASVDDEGCPPIIFGDFDRDGDVDPMDLGVFCDCTSNPFLPLVGACQAANADGDTDVDEDDFGVFQRCYSGDGVPADPACDD